MQIDIGSFLTRDSGRQTRRAFVSALLGAPAVLAGLPARLATANVSTRRAKSVIFLWLWGGPSHLDTFDPKPEAPAEIRGPFTTIPTRTAGVRFTELFPLLADRSHLFSLVRSNVNLDVNHHIAGSIALTGARGDNGDDGYGPCLGSVVQRWRAGRDILPSFISVTRGRLDTAIGPPKGIGGGNWGKAYDAFEVSCTDDGVVELPSLQLLEGLSTGRLDERRLLLTSLEKSAAEFDRGARSAWTTRFDQAYRLLASADGRQAFALDGESPRVKAAYGRTTFGQSCLLARKLVESGVPFVQVNWSKWVENIYDSRSDFGWDTHSLNFEHLAERHGPIFDRALSALLDDLSQRGLLDQTLVVALGEFGRTPKISGTGGRDHWMQCYFSLWAGGGVEGGRTIGESDATGSYPVSMPASPGMVGATILDRLGIGTEQRAELRVLADQHVIDGLT